MSKTISGVIGILIAIMILFNGALAQAIGNYASSVYIHATGLILISFILLATRSRTPFQKGIPPAFFLGGALGVFTVLFNNIGFSALGVSVTLALGLMGQALTSLFVDHYGWFGLAKLKFRREKLIGLLFIAVGIVVMTIL